MNKIHDAALSTALGVAVMAVSPAAMADQSVDIPDPSVADWTVTVLQNIENTVSVTTPANGVGGASAWEVSFYYPEREPDGRTQASPMLAATYNHFVWDPAVSGAIAAIDVSFDVRGLDSSLASGLTGRVLPAVMQNASIYRVVTEVVDVYEGGGGPTTWTLAADDPWWRGPDPRLSLDLDFSAQGSPITFGFVWELSTTCATNTTCSSLTSLDDFHFSVKSVSSVPEPATWAMLLTGLGLVGRRALLQRS